MNSNLFLHIYNPLLLSNLFLFLAPKTAQNPFTCKSFAITDQTKNPFMCRSIPAAYLRYFCCYRKKNHPSIDKGLKNSHVDLLKPIFAGNIFSDRYKFYYTT